MARFKMAAALGLLLAAAPGNADLGIPILPTGHGGIVYSTAFSTAEGDRIKDELGGLASNNLPFYIPSGELITPYNEVLAFTSYYLRGSGAELFGSTSLGGGRRPVTLYDLLFDQPAVFTRVVMLHEADHHRFGSHTCGTGADMSDTGPFGVGAYYAAASFWQSNNLDISQKVTLANLARATTVYQICTAGAQARLFNAIDNGIFSQALPPPPPPPTPVVCTFDDVGNLFCDG